MAATLRQQLMITRSLRRLRTWAPPIALGVIIGVGALIVTDYVTRADATARPIAQVAARSTTYRNCDAARADGVAPLYAGQNGYAPHLDRDGDGIACEPYREH